MLSREQAEAKIQSLNEEAELLLGKEKISKTTYKKVISKYNAVIKLLKKLKKIINVGKPEDNKTIFEYYSKIKEIARLLADEDKVKNCYRLELYYLEAFLSKLPDNMSDMDKEQCYRQLAALTKEGMDRGLGVVIHVDCKKSISFLMKIRQHTGEDSHLIFTFLLAIFLEAKRLDHTPHYKNLLMESIEDLVGFYMSNQGLLLLTADQLQDFGSACLLGGELQENSNQHYSRICIELADHVFECVSNKFTTLKNSNRIVLFTNLKELAKYFKRHYQYDRASNCIYFALLNIEKVDNLSLAIIEMIKDCYSALNEMSSLGFYSFMTKTFGQTMGFTLEELHFMAARLNEFEDEIKQMPVLMQDKKISHIWIISLNLLKMFFCPNQALSESAQPFQKIRTCIDQILEKEDMERYSGLGSQGMFSSPLNNVASRIRSTKNQLNMLHQQAQAMLDSTHLLSTTSASAAAQTINEEPKINNHTNDTNIVQPGNLSRHDSLLKEIEPLLPLKDKNIILTALQEKIAQCIDLKKVEELMLLADCHYKIYISHYKHVISDESIQLLDVSLDYLVEAKQIEATEAKCDFFIRILIQKTYGLISLRKYQDVTPVLEKIISAVEDISKNKDNYYSYLALSRIVSAFVLNHFSKEDESRFQFNEAIKNWNKVVNPAAGCLNQLAKFTIYITENKRAQEKYEDIQYLCMMVMNIIRKFETSSNEKSRINSASFYALCLELITADIKGDYNYTAARDNLYLLLQHALKISNLINHDFTIIQKAYFLISDIFGMESLLYQAAAKIMTPIGINDAAGLAAVTELIESFHFAMQQPLSIPDMKVLDIWMMTLALLKKYYDLKSLDTNYIKPEILIERINVSIMTCTILRENYGLLLCDGSSILNVTNNIVSNISAIQVENSECRMQVTQLNERIASIQPQPSNVGLFSAASENPKKRKIKLIVTLNGEPVPKKPKLATSYEESPTSAALPVAPPRND